MIVEGERLQIIEILYREFYAKNCDICFSLQELRKYLNEEDFIRESEKVQTVF